MGILEVKQVSKHFGGVIAVQEMSLIVQPREIVALIGPNGAGKTTLFNLITGVLEPDSGELRLENHNITSFKSYQRSRVGIARTFQHVELFSALNVLQNVMAGAYRLGRSSIFAELLGVPSVRSEERMVRDWAMELLAVVGLAELAAEPSSALTFGQQRLVGLARSLALRPKLILLDEPSAGLNNQESMQLGQIITGVRNSGIAVIFIEHKMDVVMSIADRIIVMSEGKKLVEGLPADIRSDSRVKEVYFGQKKED